MPRPENITEEKIRQYDEIIDKSFINSFLLKDPVIREVCYAGRYLSEKLLELNCPEDVVGQILFTAGKLSFGHDPWEIHLDLLSKFIDGTLEFEVDTEDSQHLS